jgi:hypothetical protein
MFISHRYQAIFVHIQRTGGNSIQRAFQARDPELVETLAIAPSKQRTKHCYLSDIAEAVEPELLVRYTKFAVVRNPFERMLSWYRFFADGGHEQDAGIVLGRESPSLRAYQRGLARLRAGAPRLASAYARVGHRLVEALAPASDEEIKLRCEAIGDRVMREVQRRADDFAAFLRLERDGADGLFERFYVNQIDYLERGAEFGDSPAVDAILRFETLAADFDALAARIGFPDRLPHVNASSRGRGYRAAYDQTTQALVARRFARDLAALGYTF